MSAFAHDRHCLIASLPHCPITRIISSMSDPVHIDPAVGSIVRPGAFVAAPVTVLAHDPRLDGPLRAAAASMRTSVESADITAAVRTMYKRVGIDPTKTRPSSEALLRRVRKGDELPRINS